MAETQSRDFVLSGKKRAAAGADGFDGDDVFAAKKSKLPTLAPAWEKDPAAALASARHEFGEHGGVNMSIEASATFTVMKPETMSRMFSGELGPDRGFYIYSRHFNPTVLNLGRRMAALEGTEAAYCTASGMSAISSVLLQLCSSGGHVVASRTLYGGTLTLLTHFLPRTCNITTTFVDICDHEAVKNAIVAGRTKVLYFESMSNPSLTVANIPELSRIAHDKGTVVVVDNTFSPMVLSPARLGADVVVHSISKFISGGADVIAGAVCGPSSLVNSMMDVHQGTLMFLGPTMNPKVAFELSERIPHLGLRMKEHCRRAMKYATRMKKLGLRVIYPGLEDHPQKNLSFIMDTGSSLSWFPCTSRYLCSQCAFPNVDPAKIRTFAPKLSSSKRLVGCKNPKCSWLFGPNVESRCQDCEPTSKNCTQTCPPYLIQYGLGSTGGLLLVENLVFPQKIIQGFLVGCSIVSNRQPAGIAGFGRSPESLPSQLGLRKFSYCLVSRRFDDTGLSSNMLLETGWGSDDTKIQGLSYTPFYKNQEASNPAFQEYYYVTLRKILVGDKHVKVPYSFLVPGSDGNGGTIVDSGSTFTFLERPVFELVSKEFEKQMGNYSRAREVENVSGLAPCFNISGNNNESMKFPELIFDFKGGAKMTLPLANYFSFVDDDKVVCLMIVTDNVAVGQGVRGGPAIILGNFQQQNYYIEFDLANDRFGFAKQSCV